MEGEEAIVKTIENEYGTYLNHVAELTLRYKSNPQKTATFYHGTILPSFRAVTNACIHLREINQEAMFKASERAHQIAKRAIWSMVSIGGAAIGI